eukprot:scaffold98136_cov16-Tisochrysis_lutea.AAC.1
MDLRSRNDKRLSFLHDAWVSILVGFPILAQALCHWGARGQMSSYPSLRIFVHRCAYVSLGLNNKGCVFQGHKIKQGRKVCTYDGLRPYAPSYLWLYFVAVPKKGSANKAAGCHCTGVSTCSDASGPRVSAKSSYAGAT